MSTKVPAIIACLLIAVVTTGAIEQDPDFQALASAQPVLAEIDPGPDMKALNRQAKAEAEAMGAAIAQWEAEAARIAAEKAAAEEAARQEAARVEAARQEAARQEAARQEAARRRATTTTRAPAASGGAVGGDVWARLAQCESGNTNANTGNGYYGYFQFSASTWRSVGGTGLPSDHGYGEQLHRAQILQQRSGWGQWPACSRKLGLR